MRRLRPTPRPNYNQNSSPTFIHSTKNWLFLILLIIPGIYLFSVTFTKPSPQVFYEQPIKISPLETITKESFLGFDGRFAVAIKNLKTGEEYLFNENQSFLSASLYKLWIMAEVFDQIQQGKLDPDQNADADVAELNQEFDIDPSQAEFKDGTISFTVNSALTQMITISHNYAALELTKLIKLSSVRDFLKSNQLNQSSVGNSDDPPITTTKDTLIFLEKLYKGDLANKENTDKMLALLKKQTLNDKLPKGLPKAVEIAHKTGEIDGYSHDGGIIYSPEGDYIVVVLTESKDQDTANLKIAELSKLVYNYFTQTNP